MYIPELGPSIPRRGNRFTRAVGRLVLRLMRFRIEGEAPDLPRFIIIGAPHTSNWDFVVAMGAGLALGLEFHWLGKHTIFRWPFGRLWKALGGIPVDRSAGAGVVEQVVAAFARHERFVLGLAPEGTRKKVERWKTGFYRIATGAGVPILMVYLDFRRRVVGLGEVVEPSGDMEADIARTRAYFARFPGKRPELY